MPEPVHDVVVIGAGVSGCSVARELSRRACDVLVVERADDVCEGTSKANAALVHAGYDAQPGSLMAKFNVEGNRLMFPLCEELGVAYERRGSLVVCTTEDGRPRLQELLERGEKNGVEGLRIVERAELEEMEPNISDEALCALFAPTAGIADPFALTCGMAESAAANGVTFRFDCEVTGIDRDDAGNFVLHTTTGDVTTRSVVNAAGVYADAIHNMACPDKIEIIARKGEFYLLDTTAGDHIRRTIFALPTKMGKGVALMRTAHGNLLIGPTAVDMEDKQSTDTTREGLDSVAARCAVTIKDVPLRETITQFAGLRAHRPEREFLVGESPTTPRFFDVAGIESPGFTCAPAIGVHVAALVSESLCLEDKPVGEWRPGRKPTVDLTKLTPDQWAGLCEEDPAYGNVICRCRTVSEAQIVDAIHRDPGARSVDGVKRRTCAGMGRCQGGFCSPKVMEILARELPDVELSDVTKRGPGSEFIVGEVKDQEGGVSR